MGKFPNGDTVTRLRATSTSDGYNGTVLSWASPTELSITGVGLAPRTEDEVHGAGRAGVIVGLTMYFEYGVDVTHQDRIRTADGTVYEIEGEPGSWSNPFTGTDHGMTAALRRVAG